MRLQFKNNTSINIGEPFNIYDVTVPFSASFTLDDFMTIFKSLNAEAVSELKVYTDEDELIFTYNKYTLSSVVLDGNMTCAFMHFSEPLSTREEDLEKQIAILNAEKEALQTQATNLQDQANAASILMYGGGDV